MTYFFLEFTETILHYFSSMEDAPIAELPMTNSEYYEMKSFDTVEEILQEIIVNDGATYGINIYRSASNNKGFDEKKWLIIGLGDDFKRGITVKVVGASDVLELPIFSAIGGAIIEYQSDEHVRKIVFLRNAVASIVATEIQSGKYPIPAKPTE